MIDTDSIILRHLFLQRFAQGFADRVIDQYAAGDKKLIRFLREWQADATTADVRALIRADRRNTHVKTLFDTTKTILAGQSAQAFSFVERELTELIASEGSAMAAALDTPEVERRVKPSVVLNRPVGGISITAAWQRQASQWQNQVRSVITDSVYQNLDIAAAIQGTREQNRKDGAFYTRDRRFEREAITHVNGAVNIARNDAYMAAKIERVDFLATLDHRTCLLCGNAESEGPYDYGKSPQPPLHPRCRCLIVPAQPAATERPFVEDTRSVANIPMDERPGKIGQTTIEYERFFQRQTVAGKKAILGPAKYELYKANDLKVNHFVNDRTMSLYSVREMEFILRHAGKSAL